jgi:hypothetical protein
MSLLLIAPALAETQPPHGDITVEGDGNGGSRSEALLEAKRDAVSRGIGTMLFSETQVKNFILQKHVVLTRTLGSVREYKVLSEGWQDKIYHMKISAVVSLADIRKDLVALKILMKSMDRPRMMVLIQEEGGRAAQTAIVDYLNGKEVELVDAAQVEALAGKDPAMIRKATEGDPVEAARLGADCGAEYVIAGKVVESVSQNELLKETGLTSGHATLTARVVNASNARIIATGTATAAAVHISGETAKAQAAAKAAQKLMEAQLFPKMLASFQDSVNNGLNLDVTVKKVPDFGTQEAVTALITTLENVSTVNKRAFIDGVLKLSVVFTGPVDGFAEALDGKQINGWKLAVTAVVGNRVALTLQKAPAPAASPKHPAGFVKDVKDVKE